MPLALANTIFVLLILISLVCSTFTHRWMKRPVADTVGLLFAVFLVLSVGGFIAFMAYLGAVDGSIHCFGRRCKSDYSLDQDPGLFWFAFAAWFATAAFLLSLGLGCIRLMIFGPRPSEP